MKEKVNEIVKEPGAKARVEGIRRLGKRDGEGREMLWVRFASVEEKVVVRKGKRKLRDRRERISDDLREKKRRIEW